MAVKWIWWLGLSVMAAEDLRSRRISLVFLGLWIIPGIWNLSAQGAGSEVLPHLGAAVMGLGLLFLSRVTRGALGAGDGWFFLASACYLDLREILVLFLMSLAVSFLWGTCLLLKYRDRSGFQKSVPFLACAWLPGLWIVVR